MGVAERLPVTSGDGETAPHGASLRELLDFLRRRPLAWLLPIVAFLGVLLWLAFSVLETPESPFMYRAY